RQLALPDDQLVVRDRAWFGRLPAGIEMYRAALALNAGDPGGAIAHAERTRDLSPAEDHLTRASASALAALASWTLGDLDAAHRDYLAALDGLEAGGHVSDFLGCSIAVADIAITQGRVGEAQRALERALDLAVGAGPRLRGSADMHVA